MSTVLEDRVSEKANELALKWTGFELSELPESEQYSIWQEAKRQVNDSIVDAAELRREMMLDREMRL